MSDMRGVTRGRVVLLTTAVAVACATQQSMRIRAEARPGTSFAGYTTYAWRSASAARPEWPARDDRTALDWRIRSLVDREMLRRGFTGAGARDAGLLIDYHIRTRDTAIEDQFGEYARYRAEGGRQGWGDAWVGGYREGTLVIEASDRRTGELVWYGAATAVVNPELREKRLPIAVERIFERFPARR